jgi:hypothetical protein
MEINLRELETGQHHYLKHVAMTSYAHDASVCFESQNHPEQFDMIGEGNFINTYQVVRYNVTDEMKRTSNDDEEATHYGAYAVAFIVASKELGIKAFERSKKGTGIDYWLGSKKDLLFQNKMRLEVSGIRNGDNNQIQTRFNTKMNQSKKSDTSSIPAFIVIVEFSQPKTLTGLRS